MTYRNILVSREDRVVNITINRPEFLNALNPEAVEELLDAVQQVEEDGKTNKVIGLVVTGAGKRSFCSGADLNEIQSLSPSEYLAFLERSLSLLEMIWQMSVTTVAAVNGFALGGGCEIAMACDLRIAVAEARLGLPELGMSMLPGWGGVHFMSRIIGWAKTLEFVLTGRTLTAQESLAAGLVTKVVVSEDLFSEARSMIDRIGEKGPVAVKLVKEIINNYEFTDIKKSAFHEALCSLACFVTDDARKGMESFKTKQKPVFEGK